MRDRGFKPLGKLDSILFLISKACSIDINYQNASWPRWQKTRFPFEHQKSSSAALEQCLRGSFLSNDLQRDWGCDLVQASLIYIKVKCSTSRTNRRATVQGYPFHRGSKLWWVSPRPSAVVHYISTIRQTNLSSSFFFFFFWVIMNISFDMYSVIFKMQAKKNFVFWFLSTFRKIL